MEVKVSTDAKASPESLLEQDVISLLNLGLKLSDLERIWMGVPSIKMDTVRKIALGQLGGRGITVSRQASLGLDMMRAGSVSEADAIVPEVVRQLRAELDSPPEKYRDPITLELINEPMVLSSGHVFSKSTLFDSNGQFRFKCCPMTREAVAPMAFPLVYLRRELIEWKLRRLDSILDATSHVNSAPLLELARSLLQSLGAHTYQSQARLYWTRRLHVPAGPYDEQAKLLREMSSEVAALRTAGLGGSNELLDLLTQAMRKILEALVQAVRELWADEGMRAEASELMCKVCGDLAAVGPLRWEAEENVTSSALNLLTEMTSDASVTDAYLLNQAATALPPPPTTQPSQQGIMPGRAVAYWRLRLRCAAGADEGSAAWCERHGTLARQLVAALPASVWQRAVDARVPRAIIVEGAGLVTVNGRYELDGCYSQGDGSRGAIKYSQGRTWLLRYRLPSGRACWYLADSTQLTKDDGDYYRVHCEDSTPPCHLTWSCAKDGVDPPPSLRPVYDSNAAPMLTEDDEGETLQMLLAEVRTKLQSHGMDVSRFDPVAMASPPPSWSSSSEPPPTPSSVPHTLANMASDELRPLIGDCLEVRDTHGLWATARVVAIVLDEVQGLLLLVHFEGWSQEWLMWLSMAHDADRLRALTPQCPGIGNAGPHGERSFNAVVEAAHERIASGFSTWAPTSGAERTAPYRNSVRGDESTYFRLRTTTPPSVVPRRPFQTCEQLAADPALCQRMLGGVLRAHPTNAESGFSSGLSTSNVALSLSPAVESSPASVWRNRSMMHVVRGREPRPCVVQ